MKKRIGAFLLALALCLGGAAQAEADWAGDVSRELAARLIALAADEGYVSLFTSSEDILAEIARMAENEGCEIVSERRFLLREDAIETLWAVMAAEGDTPPEMGEAAREAVQKRLGSSVTSMLNGTMGVSWLGAASILSEAGGYLMPEGFAPCAVLLDYGTAADVMVVFAQTGEGVIGASASFVAAQAVEDSQEILSLLYTEE